MGNLSKIKCDTIQSVDSQSFKMVERAKVLSNSRAHIFFNHFYKRVGFYQLGR